MVLATGSAGTTWSCAGSGDHWLCWRLGSWGLGSDLFGCGSYNGCGWFLSGRGWFGCGGRGLFSCGWSFDWRFFGLVLWSVRSLRLVLTLWSILLRSVWLLWAFTRWTFTRVFARIFRIFWSLTCWSLLTSGSTAILVNGSVTLLITRWFIWVITSRSPSTGCWLSSSRAIRANIGLTTCSYSNCCAISKRIYKWPIVNIFTPFIIIGWSIFRVIFIICIVLYFIKI